MVPLWAPMAHSGGLGGAFARGRGGPPLASVSSRPMRFTEIVGPSDVVTPLEATDKWEAIRTLVDHVVDAGRAPRDLAKALHEQVLARERSMSTGMERGIAIPHAAVDGLESIVGALGVVTKPEGLAFDSIDARPAHLVVLLLIPRAQKLAHIRTLADIARLLGREEVREALLEPSDGETVWQQLARHEPAS